MKKRFMILLVLVVLSIIFSVSVAFAFETIKISMSDFFAGGLLLQGLQQNVGKELYYIEDVGIIVKVEKTITNKYVKIIMTMPDEYVGKQILAFIMDLEDLGIVVDTEQHTKDKDIYKFRFTKRSKKYKSLKIEAMYQKIIVTLYKR